MAPSHRKRRSDALFMGEIPRQHRPSQGALVTPVRRLHAAAQRDRHGSVSAAFACPCYLFRMRRKILLALGALLLVAVGVGLTVIGPRNKNGSNDMNLSHESKIILTDSGKEIHNSFKSAQNTQ
jgi:hypothetical protein